MTRLWKSLKLKNDKLVSGYDGSEWIIGEWRIVPVPEKECVGLNACPNLLDAINYVAPDVIAEVEVFGGCIKGDDKVTCERMRILRAWKWEKKDSVALAIYSAQLCLDNFEKRYPEDKRPRQAIEAAERWLNDPTEENKVAARSATWSATWSARSAAGSAESAAGSARSVARSATWSATWSAAWSARSAAGSAARSVAESSAESATWSAAWSARSAAESAAWSARSAAWSARSAAESVAKKKIHNWIVKHLVEIEELRQEKKRGER